MNRLRHLNRTATAAVRHYLRLRLRRAMPHHQMPGTRTALPDRRPDITSFPPPPPLVPEPEPVPSPEQRREDEEEALVRGRLLWRMGELHTHQEVRNV